MRRLRSLSLIIVALSFAGTAAAQNVGVNPQSLTFTYQIGGPNPPAQNLYVFNDIPTQFSVTISGAPWLSIAPMSGITPNTLVCTVTPPAGAVPGTLNGSIIIGPPASADAVKVVVPVTLQILPGAPGNLVVAPGSLNFSYQSGSPNPAPYFVSVTSTGAAASFTASASTSSGGAWLSVSPNSGVTPFTLTVSVNVPSGMNPGTYTGNVTVVPSYAGGTPQKIAVTLNVSAGGSIAVSPAYLTFSYQPGASLPNPQTLSVTNSAGAATTVNVAPHTTSGGPWLVISPGIATTPLNVIVSVQPGNLQPGTYYGNVSVAPAVGGAATLIPVTLNVYNYSKLLAAPSTLSFNYQAGAQSPAAQYISVTSTGGPVTFAASVFGPSWVSLSTYQGVTPAGIAVNVNPPATTAPGTYNATITFAPVSTVGSSATVSLSINVTAANYLSIPQNTVTFDYSTAGPTPPPVVIPVSSTGGPVRFEAVAGTIGFSPWLNVSQSSMYTPAHINVSVAPQGLAAGTYSGTVSVISDDAANSPQTINVTLKVTAQPEFTASPFGMAFTYQTGGPAAPMQLAVITSPGAQMNFTVATQSANWLLAAGGGSTPGTIAVTVDPGKLAPGTYTGSVLISPTTGTGDTVRMPIILNVSATPAFRPNVNQVVFQYERTGPVPHAQTVNVQTTGTTPVVFYPTTETGDGGGWLTASPNTAVSPADLTVAVNPQGLGPGLYYGVVALNDASGSTPTSYVPVSLQVSDDPILTVPSQSLTFSAKAGDPATPAQSIVVNGTGRASQFEVNTNGASWLQVNPTFGTTNATLSVVANPDGMPAGYYFGVVTISISGVTGSQQYVPVGFVLSAP